MKISLTITRQTIHTGLVLLLMAALSGCATTAQNNSNSAPANAFDTAPHGSTVIWHSGIQFVALTPQPPDASPNHQPIDISPTTMRSVLGALKVARSSQDSDEPIFTAGTLKVLSPLLAQALSQAGPHKDVTFAMVTRGEPAGAPMLIIHIRQPLVTTGRVFYRNDHLNIIFGLVHSPFEQHYIETGQLPPLTPGQRAHRVQSGWKVVSDKQLTYPRPTRHDWVSVTLTSQPTRTVTPQTTTRTSPASPSDENHTADSEYQNLATRLRVLDKLHRQGLITDQEYQDKRRQILNGL